MSRGGFENGPDGTAAVDFAGLDDGERVAGRCRELVVVRDEQNRSTAFDIPANLAANGRTNALAEAKWAA
jgi:hypothetical protein